MIKLFQKCLLGLSLLLLILVSCQSNVESSIISPIVQQEESVPSNHKVSFEGVAIGEPIKYKNLQVFPITGSAALDSINYLTLGVAMETNKVVVHETGSVNNLSITNKSDQYIYIQSGDIVKGGRQDRTIQYDVLIPPHAKKMALSSFCVEQSRWHKREGEEASHFSTSEKMLSNREVKLAAKSKGDQGSVWSSVSKTQDKINVTLKDEVSDTVDVRVNASASSLQLALENKDLKKLIEEYKTALDSVLPLDSLIGFAYAVNGVFYGIEVYNNSFLFKEMKNKLIESIITEAISDKKIGEEQFETLELEDLMQLLASVKYESEEHKINEASKWISSIDKKNKLHNYTLIDLAHNDEWLHKNWVNAVGIEEKTSSRELMQSNDVRSISPSNVYPQRVERIEIK